MPKAIAIEVRGARTHNLKGIDCRIPHRKVTVVTGLSGAGKSSLAFDTVFAESQRRFIESMSTYARQFLGQMERPPVDEIRNILPSVALEARNSVRNARSTVGTITEALDVLRLLFTHLGVPRCPEGHGPARRMTPDDAADELMLGAVGEHFYVVARQPRPTHDADLALSEWIRQGYLRALDADGEVVRLDPEAGWRDDQEEILLVLGRFKVGGSRSNLVSTLEEGYRLAHGRLEARGDRGVRYYTRGLACPVCGNGVRTPTPPLFSFNSPLGACPECQGFGRVIGVDPDRVVPDPSRSLADHAIAPWSTPAYEDRLERLLVACAERGVPTDVPWRDLKKKDRNWIWRGEGDFVSIERFFEWLEKRSYRVHLRVLLSKYRAYDPCPSCGGGRLQPESLLVTLEGATLPELTRLSIGDLRAWIGERPWTKRQRELAGHLLDELEQRVDVLYRVGLDYLTLDRQARTLAGGETQRIHLAAALGSGLTNTLYVLDEPTVGLHPSDSDRLLELLRDLTGRGNTVLVVEHDRTIVAGADHLIDLGPAAGEHGGEIVSEGTVEEILADPNSVTGRLLGERPVTSAREHLRRFRRERGRITLSEEIAGKPQVEIRGARAHNLKGFDVAFPFQVLVAVTGVSGSGKSSLVGDVLHGHYRRAQGAADVEVGECDEILGLDSLDSVTLVDQNPVGRSTRSNPVTYIKGYDDLRALFASTQIAKRRGIKAGHFSFNTSHGRCPTCEGTGFTSVDMQFMAPVTVSCETCDGKRFRPEVLAIRARGMNIAEVLELTVSEALERFGDRKKLARSLGYLVDVGLGYLRLGQATSTLSGGEAQRLKLASFLGRRAGDKPHLLLFDEPTTGLHIADIDLLYQTLRRLVGRGDGVVVVEHSIDLIARADWIVDLGPGGGAHGGELIYSGPLEPFLDDVSSPTADELRRHLQWCR